MNSKGTELEQVLQTHWTSFRCVWPRGFGALKSSPYSWISSSMDSSLIHFLYGPNTCSHCIKGLKRTYPICHAPLSRLARELCSFTEIARKSQLLCVNRSLIRYGFRTGASAVRYIVWAEFEFLVGWLINFTPSSGRDPEVLYMSKTDITTLTFLPSKFCLPWLRNFMFFGSRGAVIYSVI